MNICPDVRNVEAHLERTIKRLIKTTRRSYIQPIGGAFAKRLRFEDLGVIAAIINVNNTGVYETTKK